MSSLRALLRSTHADALIVTLTFTVTVAVDLVTAVGVGIAAAIVLALRAVARTARLDQVPLDHQDRSAEVRALLNQHIVAYRLDGPLVFAAAHQFLLQLTEITDVRVVILRMSRVTTLDATGAQVLGDAIEKLEQRGITVMLSGVAADHQTLLATLRVAEKLRSDGLLFVDTPTAIERARLLLNLTTDADSTPAQPPHRPRPPVRHLRSPEVPCSRKNRIISAEASGPS